MRAVGVVAVALPSLFRLSLLASPPCTHTRTAQSPLPLLAAAVGSLTAAALTVSVGPFAQRGFGGSFSHDVHKFFARRAR